MRLPDRDGKDLVALTGRLSRDEVCPKREDRRGSWWDRAQGETFSAGGPGRCGRDVWTDTVAGAGRGDLTLRHNARPEK